MSLIGVDRDENKARGYVLGKSAPMPLLADVRNRTHRALGEDTDECGGRDLKLSGLHDE